MNDIVLSNKPLVEAIFEMKWAASPPASGSRHALPISADPYYRVLVGRFYERVIGEYPTYEELPVASWGPELLVPGNVIHHRFRVAEDSWPLVQIGPGILSVNSTADYIWRDFRGRCLRAVEALLGAHPKPETINVTNILLRYIDAIPWDFVEQNVFVLLASKLHTNISIPASRNPNVSDAPHHISLNLSFPSSAPMGFATVRFYNAVKNQSPALVWETAFESTSTASLKTVQADLAGWVDAAHSITHDLFFSLIEGDLLEQFK